MQEWYVYHSVDTMEHDYSSVGGSSVYSTTLQPKLCFNDVIWVIEGSKSNPKRFSLVDCFQYEKTEYPPFASEYSTFKLRAIGSRSLIKEPIPLGKENEWFSRLHKAYITKQKFFCLLSTEPEIINGLREVSGVGF